MGVQTLIHSAVAAALLSSVTAKSRYPRLVPNARQVVVDGVRAIGLGHPTLDARSDLGKANQFGNDLEAAIDQVGSDNNAQAVWTILCELDSDGDGIKNKDELCDPGCNNPGGNPVCPDGTTPTHPGFAEGAVISSDLPSELKLHGALMIMAWIFLAPFGILRAIFFKKMPGKPTWFRDHRMALMGSVVLTFLAFIVIVSFQGTDAISLAFDNPDSASSKHIKYGIFVLVLAVIQPVSGFLRAHLPEKGQAKSSLRLAWEFQHQWTGRLTLILAVAAVATGIPLLYTGKEGYGTFLIVVLVLVGAGSFVYVLGFREKHVEQVKAQQDDGEEAAARVDAKLQEKAAQKQVERKSNKFSKKKSSHRELAQAGTVDIQAVEEANPRFSKSQKKANDEDLAEAPAKVVEAVEEDGPRTSKGKKHEALDF